MTWSEQLPLLIIRWSIARIIIKPMIIFIYHLIRAVAHQTRVDLGVFHIRKHCLGWKHWKHCLGGKLVRNKELGKTWNCTTVSKQSKTVKSSIEWKITLEILKLKDQHWSNSGVNGHSADLHMNGLSTSNFKSWRALTTLALWETLSFIYEFLKEMSG